MALVKTKEVERRENNNFLVARKGTKRKRKLLLLCSRQKRKRNGFVLRLGRKIENFTPATKLGHELTLRERINLVNFRIDRSRSIGSRTNYAQTQKSRLNAADILVTKHVRGLPQFLHPAHISAASLFLTYIPLQLREFVSKGV